MKLSEFKNYFGSKQKFHVITGMSRANVRYWDLIGYIPITSQLRIEEATCGDLKADITHLKAER